MCIWKGRGREGLSKREWFRMTPRFLDSWWFLLLRWKRDRSWKQSRKSWVFHWKRWICSCLQETQVEMSGSQWDKWLSSSEWEVRAKSKFGSHKDFEAILSPAAWMRSPRKRWWRLRSDAETELSVLHLEFGQACWKRARLRAGAWNALFYSTI